MRISQSLEEKFTILSLLFFTKTLEFNSLFVTPEGASGFAVLDDYNPLRPALSIVQHSIFLFTLFLLLIRWKSTLSALLRNKFLILLIVVFLSSFLWSSFPELTLRRSISLLQTTAFGLYFAARYTIREQLKLLAWAFGLCIIINILFILAVPRHGIEYGKHVGAFRGAIEQKNFFGRLMALGAIVFSTMIPETKRELLLRRIGFCLAFLLVLLSTSKTALFVTICLLFILFPLYRSLRWSVRSATLFQTLSLSIISCVAIVIASNLESFAAATGRDLTLTGRTEIWRGTLFKLQDSPWLGFGYQGFWHGLEGPSFDVFRLLGSQAYAPHSHNGILELLTSVGIVGFSIFTISFLVVCRRALTLAKSTQFRDGLWLLLYVSFLLIYNQTENTLVEHNSIFWVVYVAIALTKLPLPISSPEPRPYLVESQATH
jgi:exopolysaccharide production protein ExoQ